MAWRSRGHSMCRRHTGMWAHAMHLHLPQGQQMQHREAQHSITPAFSARHHYKKPLLGCLTVSLAAAHPPVPSTPFPCPSSPFPLSHMHARH